MNEGSYRPFTFQGAREPKSTVSFNHQGVPFWLQWWHTRRLKETPTPKDPMQLLSDQTELPTLPLWRCALCTQVWQFKMAPDPLQSLQRMLHYYTWCLPLAWSVLQYTLLTLESAWKNTDFLKHLQKFLWPHKIPWLAKISVFPWLESHLNFPGFPVWVETLIKKITTSLYHAIPI